MSEQTIDILEYFVKIGKNKTFEPDAFYAISGDATEWAAKGHSDAASYTFTPDEIHTVYSDILEDYDTIIARDGFNDTRYLKFNKDDITQPTGYTIQVPTNRSNLYVFSDEDHWQDFYTDGVTHNILETTFVNPKASDIFDGSRTSVIFNCRYLQEKSDIEEEYIPRFKSDYDSLLVQSLAQEFDILQDKIEPISSRKRRGLDDRYSKAINLFFGKKSKYRTDKNLDSNTEKLDLGTVYIGSKINQENQETSVLTLNQIPLLNISCEEKGDLYLLTDKTIGWSKDSSLINNDFLPTKQASSFFSSRLETILR